MRGSRKFCQRGSKFDNICFLFFVVGEGIEDPDTAIYWPSSARQQTPFKRCFAGGPMMSNIECWLGSFVIFQGIRTSIAKKPYIFCDFSEGVTTLDPHMCIHRLICASDIGRQQNGVFSWRDEDNLHAVTTYVPIYQFLLCVILIFFIDCHRKEYNMIRQPREKTFF